MNQDETLRGPVRMWLTVFAGQTPKEVVEVTGPAFMVGRGQGCDLVIDDPRVSREHAVIAATTGPFRVVRDLGSENGTILNGRTLRAPPGFAREAPKEAELVGGEWLVFGDTVARVTLFDPRTTGVAETLGSAQDAMPPLDGFMSE